VHPLDIRRDIDNPGEFRRLNVILVTVESLSAKYLGVSVIPQLDTESEPVAPESCFLKFLRNRHRTDRG
jgi:hypothetical protein